MKLKADLHLHTTEDLNGKQHSFFKLLSPNELIDLAWQNGYEVLSLTHHGFLFKDDYLEAYAKERGILLLPGIEVLACGKHVLLYNFNIDEEEISFEKIRRLKNSSNLVIAPHPFYGTGKCLGRKLLSNIDLFDAIEFCHFYTRYFNRPNKKASKLASQLGLPLIGNSDTHIREQFGTTYSLIETEEKSMEAVISSIKSNRAEVISRPLSTLEFLRVAKASILENFLVS